jgi:predicted GIY-YIG superfamily endonuclease
MAKNPKRITLSLNEIIKIAKRFATLKEFKARHLDLYSHLVYKKKVQFVCKAAGLARRTQNNYWTYERVLKAANKCKTRSEFIHKFPSAYKYAKDQGQINKIYKAASLKSKYNRGWTLQDCAREAAKYKTRTDFFNSSPAYHFALRRGWIDEICVHMQPQGNYTQRKLYAFEHPDKSVYVGLTHNYERRFKHHMESHKLLIQKKGEIGHTFVMYDVLYPAIVASQKERDLIEDYRAKGWTILSKNKAGSLGGNIVKWTFEACRKEAKKYNTRREFQIYCPSAVVIARRNGWMNQICSHMKRLARPKYTDRELEMQASRFTSRFDFRDKNFNAYQVAAKRGILDRICVHMGPNKVGGPPIKWTLQACKDDALKYQTKSEWQKNSSGYNSAIQKGWMDQCCSHMGDSKRGRNQWAGHYSWTDDQLILDAAKYQTRKEWREHSRGYSVAKSRGILSKCCKHMRRLSGTKLSDEQLIQSALRYKSRKEWEIHESGKYQVALKRGKPFFERCCLHMKPSASAKWTDEELIESAKPYKTATEWQRACGGAYTTACKRGRTFLALCCAHMKRGRMSRKAS